MKIESIDKKAKPPGYINFGQAIELISKAAFGDVTDDNAAGFDSKAYALLRKELRYKRIKIKIRSKKDKTNEYYKYPALGGAIWDNERKSIFETGRITYQNKAGKTFKGILFLKKIDVTEYAKQLKKLRSSMEVSNWVDINEKTAKIIFAYIERLAKNVVKAGYQKSSDGKLYIFVTFDQVFAYAKELAGLHKWKMKETSFRNYFHPSDKTNSLLLPLGIAQEGRPIKKPVIAITIPQIIADTQKEIKKETQSSNPL